MREARFSAKTCFKDGAKTWSDGQVPTLMKSHSTRTVGKNDISKTVVAQVF